MRNFKSMMYRFLQGRYGTDQLNKVLLFLTFLIIVVNAFVFKMLYVNIFAYIILLYTLYRSYSRQIYKRQRENLKYMGLTKPIRRRFQLLKKRRQDRVNQYYLCSKCLQIVRVPRGRGVIEITCPKCKSKFSKKT